jgi:XRE family transcriptional regulator, regulator of sulfur utilization
MDIYRDVGARIRARRLHQELTLDDLSELTGLHPAYIGQVERGQKKASVVMLAVIARSLGVGAEKLFAPSGALRAATLGHLIDAASRGNTSKERKVILEVIRRLARSLREHRS